MSEDLFNRIKARIKDGGVPEAVEIHNAQTGHLKRNLLIEELRGSSDRTENRISEARAALALVGEIVPDIELHVNEFKREQDEFKAQQTSKETKG